LDHGVVSVNSGFAGLCYATQCWTKTAIELEQMILQYECGKDEESITHMLFYCEKYNQLRSDLMDTLEELCCTLQHRCKLISKIKFNCF